MKNLLLAALFLLLPAGCTSDELSPGRSIQNFNLNWRFLKGHNENAHKLDFNDTNWRPLDLPHDYSVEGPFSSTWASGTAYLPAGIGWYRKTFTIDKNLLGRKVYICFDDIYNNSQVWINEHYLGKRPNGYIAFQYDLTDHLNYGKENVIAVKVDHTKYADSRWYTGSGIYRNVKLLTTAPVHIAQWGLYATTPQISSDKAVVKIRVDVLNESNADSQVNVENSLLDCDKTVAKDTKQINIPASGLTTVTQNLNVANPKLWDVDNPNLYTLHTKITNDAKIVVDNVSTKIGIRDTRFDPDKGFFLNGTNTKFKGVCLHHDAGVLGSAVPKKVWARRLDILKQMGCNAIRTSHNPYSTEFYDLCDEKGFLVIDEAFDEWELPKNKWVKGWNVGAPAKDGYFENFTEWGRKDLADLIRKNRNHPSIIMWSIGNEVDYPNDPYTHPILNDSSNPQTSARYRPQHPHADRLGQIAKELVAVIKEHDTSRPVTAGLASAVMSNETGYATALDVVGYNYQEPLYTEHHKLFPKRILYGSETGRSLNSWKAVEDNDFIMGQFIWTGIEYLGEARQWPVRHSTSGIVDLAGFKKPQAFFQQSLWSEKPMIFIAASDAAVPQDRSRSFWRNMRLLPHWNWPETKMIKVSAFTNCPQVELFLNDKSLGTKDFVDFPDRIITWELPFEEGTLRAVASKDGVKLAACELKTAQKASRILAKSDTYTLKADRQDLAQIEVFITDQKGNPVYDAQNSLTCNIEGPARLLGIENANPRDTTDYKLNTRKTYRGRVIVYIQALDKKGTAKIKLTSPGLKPAEIELNIVK